MDGHPVLVVHLVELIDEADTLVCQHQSTALQSPLARDGILLDRSRQTHRTGTLTCSQAADLVIMETAFRRKHVMTVAILTAPYVQAILPFPYEVAFYMVWIWRLHRI